MGYRDDFYMVQNIIGFTGDIQDFPTVYFQKGTEFGHITQKHGDSQNVGRMEVYSSASYFIGNEDVSGTMKLVEKIDGKIFHESRSTLTKVDVFATAQRDTVALLAQSIYNRDQGEKYISGWSKKDFQTVDATIVKKAKLLAELPRAK